MTCKIVGVPDDARCSLVRKARASTSPLTVAGNNCTQRIATSSSVHVVAVTGSIRSTTWA